jgi:hypothetical protein
MPIRPENRKRYPADWPARSRFVRFYRANGRCEGCGAVHGRPHPVTGATVVLTTAHVYDERPEAAGLLNLAAWCQRCHNRHDAKGRRSRRRQRAEDFASQTPTLELGFSASELTMSPRLRRRLLRRRLAEVLIKEG